MINHLLFLVLTFAVFISGWLFSLRTSGKNVSPRDAAYSWLLANAGKYIPGKIFMFAGRLSLCNSFGVRKSECFWAMSIEHFFMLTAAVPFLIITINKGYDPDTITIYAICFILVVDCLLIVKPQLFLIPTNKILNRLGHAPLAKAPSPRYMVQLLIIYLSGWFFYSLSGIILLRALEVKTDMPLVSIMAVFVTSWLIGFISMLTPGGIGVREAVIVVLLQPEIPVPQAIAIALLARLTWSLIEILGIGGGFYLKRATSMKV
jgi:uncharacterized membrane protein YbhN (UPF0104 family)